MYHTKDKITVTNDHATLAVGRRPILRRNAMLGVDVFLEKKVYFGKYLILEIRPNFGVRAIDGKKTT